MENQEKIVEAVREYLLSVIIDRVRKGDDKAIHTQILQNDEGSIALWNFITEECTIYQPDEVKKMYDEIPDYYKE